MTTSRFKIGDFSHLGQVSVRTLRLYDEMELFKPAATDNWTGYRYYTLDQLPRLNRILALKDLGLSLEQIAHLLKNDLPAQQMRGMLRQKESELEQQLDAMQKQRLRVQARLQQIENEQAPPKYEVILKSLSAMTIASLRIIVPRVEDMATLRFEKLNEMYAALAEQQIKPLDPEIFVYHLPGYSDENIDTEIATSVEVKVLQDFPQGADILTVRQLPGVETAASVVHHGSIWGIPDAIAAVYAWAGMNGWESAGPYRELHHGWRENETCEEDLFTRITLEIQLPVTPFRTMDS